MGGTNRCRGKSSCCSRTASVFYVSSSVMSDVLLSILLHWFCFVLCDLDAVL